MTQVFVEYFNYTHKNIIIIIITIKQVEEK